MKRKENSKRKKNIVQIRKEETEAKIINLTRIKK